MQAGVVAVEFLLALADEQDDGQRCPYQNPDGGGLGFQSASFKSKNARAWAIARSRSLSAEQDRDDTHAAEYREEDDRAARRMADMRDGGISGEDGE